MIRRIDLRGADAASVDYRALRAARRLRRRGRAACGAADLRRRPRRAASRRSRSTPPSSTASSRPTSPCRARPCTTALAALDPAVRAGLEESIRRLRTTCEAELEHDVVTDLGPGARVTQRMVPVDRVGLYVPGGVAPLVSSVRDERRPRAGRRRRARSR